MPAAITDAYASATEYRTGISPHKTDTTDDAEILNDLVAITRYIEKRLDRFFGKDAAAVARSYYPPYTGYINAEAENPWRYARGGRTLWLDGDDLVSVTGVMTDENGDGTVDTAWTVNVDYQLWPLNAALGPEPKPYKMLYIPTWPNSRLRWPPGRLVTVTGVWGWPAIPAAVKRGVIQLTAILRLETPRATAQVNDIGEVLAMSPQASGIVQELIRHYGKISV